MIDLQRNWAGNQAFQAQRVHHPRSVDELRELVARCEHLKPIGARHSFTTIADTSGDMISMEHFNQMLAVDEDRQTVTVQAGMPYGLFCSELHQAGFGIHNMASLPQITVGGACATATHGSGDMNGNLATAVTGLKLVTADGELIEISRDRDPDVFPGIVVGLGGFGVVTEMTLEIRPTYTVRQDIYENLPVSRLATHFNDIMACGYSVSLFTDWQGEHVNQLWVKQLIPEGETGEAPAERFGAGLAETVLHPLPDKDADRCTDQLGATGPWHERLPHFRMDAIGTSGDELQTEYFVARKHAADALQVVASLQDRIAPVIKVSEIRTVDEDDLWMSPSYECACVGIHFTWKPDWPSVQRLLPLMEQELEPFSPRPHWGKLFTMPPGRVQALYPRYADFRALMERFDPAGKFRNEFLESYILS